MQEILTKALPALTLEIEGTQLPSGTNGVRIRGVRELRASLKAASRIPGLAIAARQILDSPVLLLEPDKAITTHTGHQELATPLAAFRLRSTDLLEAIAAALPPQSPLSIGIQLPRTTDVGKLSDIIASLERAFALPTAAVCSDPGRFQNMDTGSDWIELSWMLDASLRFVGELIKICVRFTEERQKADSAVALLKTASAPPEGRDAAAEALDAVFLALRQRIEADGHAAILQAIANMHPEMDEAHVNANAAICLEGMRSMSELLQQGGRIQPALGAPEYFVASLPEAAAQGTLAAPAAVAQLAASSGPASGGPEKG